MLPGLGSRPQGPPMSRSASIVELLRQPDEGSSFGGDGWSVAGWVEVQGLGVLEGVGPAAFVEHVVVFGAEEVEVVGSGGAAVGDVDAVVCFAPGWGPVAAGA